MQPGTRIVADFVTAIASCGHYSIARTQLSQNVYHISGDADLLVYVKGRAGEPYRWGITANIITRLRQQTIKWVVILLYDTKETGYFLPSSDVLYYIQKTWPLGADGDYKPATGSYLRNHQPFNSLEMLFALMRLNKIG